MAFRRFRIESKSEITSAYNIWSAAFSETRLGCWTFSGFWIDSDAWDAFEHIHKNFIINDRNEIVTCSYEVAGAISRIIDLDWGKIYFQDSQEGSIDFVASCVDGAFWVVLVRRPDIAQNFDEHMAALSTEAGLHEIDIAGLSDLILSE